MAMPYVQKCVRMRAQSVPGGKSCSGARTRKASPRGRRQRARLRKFPPAKDLLFKLMDYQGTRGWHASRLHVRGV
eukprot:5040564-Prymnesium_polylepis.1